MVALVQTALMLPLMLVAALAIKLTSRGPVLYSQERVGKGGRLFNLYKFRTMIERLANWLLLNLEPQGEGGVVSLPFSRRRLAAHLGATPETLSRIFSELCAHGVSGRSQEIRIASIAALEKVAHPDPLIDGPA